LRELKDKLEILGGVWGFVSIVLIFNLQFFSFVNGLLMAALDNFVAFITVLQIGGVAEHTRVLMESSLSRDIPPIVSFFRVQFCNPVLTLSFFFLMLFFPV
jgi:hypothetical protein